MTENSDKYELGEPARALPPAMVHSSHPRTSAPMAAFDKSGGITIGMVHNAIMRWWKVALPVGLTLALTGAGLVWLFFVPKYESTATLEIKENTPYIVFDAKEQSRKFVTTQIQLIKQRIILADALAGIEGIPELAQHRDPIDWVRSELQIENIEKSELFVLRYLGRTADGAKKVLDAVVNTYLDYVRKQDDSETRRVIELLDLERSGRKRVVDRLREQVRDKTKELTGRDPFTPGGGPTAFSLQNPMANLISQRVDAEVGLKVLEAQLQAYEEKPVAILGPSDRSLREAVESAPEVVKLNQSIQENRAKLNEYAATVRNAEKTATYKRYEEKIRTEEDALAKLRTELTETLRADAIAQAESARKERIQAMTGEIERQRLTTQFLKKQYDEQMKKMEQTGGDSLDLEFYRTELEREEKVFALISDRTLALKTELAAPGRVKLIDPANLPNEPQQRAPWRNLLVVTLIGFCAPFGIAVIWERTAKRVGDASTLKRSDLNVLAEVAALPLRSRGGGSFTSQRSQRDLSLFEESIDSLRTGLRLSRQLKDMRVLAVSSAVSREGKTSLASQLAVSIARSSGERTLLIDADMRAPNICQIFDISNEHGLADVLARQCEPEDVIHTEYSELLHLLPAGELKASPHKLVGDESFRDVIAHLRQEYRYIIVDTPPVLSAGESLVLSSATDATLLCAMRNRSRTEQVREAYNRLVNADANPIGVVLNGVPVHRYSYAYGKYGYGRYKYPRH